MVGAAGGGGSIMDVVRLGGLDCLNRRHADVSAHLSHLTFTRADSFIFIGVKVEYKAGST